MLPFVLSLGLIWGCVWAAFLQWSEVGRFLAARRTWLTVVIGVGGDVLILFLYLPLHTMAVIVGVVAMSAIGIVARSLYNEWRDERAVVEMAESRGH